MRALPESDRNRRLVAVAVSAADVLHPQSGLRQVAAAAGETDVLVARVAAPETARLPLPADAPDYPDDEVGQDGPAQADDALDGALDDTVDDTVDELLAGFTVPLPGAGDPGTDGSHLPASLHLHHLNLRWRVQEADEPDLVAALSELIGFDPDDQVFCVAPSTGPDGRPDPELTAVDRAVRRVAQVYGLPVLHYRRIPDELDPGVLPAHPEVIV